MKYLFIVSGMGMASLSVAQISSYSIGGSAAGSATDLLTLNNPVGPNGSGGYSAEATQGPPAAGPYVSYTSIVSVPTATNSSTAFSFTGSLESDTLSNELPAQASQSASSLATFTLGFSLSSSQTLSYSLTNSENTITTRGTGTSASDSVVLDINGTNYSGSGTVLLPSGSNAISVQTMGMSFTPDPGNNISASEFFKESFGLSLQAAPVPEPTTLLPIGFGFAFCFLRKRSRS